MQGLQGLFEVSSHASSDQGTALRGLTYLSKEQDWPKQATAKYLFIHTKTPVTKPL